MDSPTVFFGHASNAEARVYAQCKCEACAALPEMKISGTISGPHSLHARTLPATIPFRFLGAAENVPLAEAIVPDPCFWTPESPYVYQVKLDVHCRGELITHHEQLIGIRPLGARGRSFFLDGRRWVLRGAFSSSKQSAALTEWRDSALSACLSVCDDTDMLTAASKQGLLVIGHITGDYETSLPRLDQLSHWPAVGMVLIDAAVEDAAIVSRRPRNILLGQRLRVDETVPDFQPAPWADFVVGDVDDPALFHEQTRGLQIPIVACRHLAEDRPPHEIRRACEQLQEELSPHGDFAGYLV